MGNAAVETLRRAFRPPVGLNLHISSTYFGLRFWLGGLAFGLPLYLWWRGVLFDGIPLQNSLSAYYHAGGGEMRDEFVGVLFAVGLFLLVYRGYTKEENWALNVAGVSLIGVAYFPTASGCEDACIDSPLHGLFAATFFLCIAFVMAFCAKASLEHAEGIRKQRYERFYQGLGLLVLAIVVGTLVAIIVTRPNFGIFLLESLGSFAFGLFWLVKSMELRKTFADQR